jgi:Beta-lactamase enzyme family
MDAAPPLPPPAIEQPAPRQVSYGVVSGRAAPGARRVVVYAGGRVLGARPLRGGSTRGRRFWLRVPLPMGDVNVRVSTLAADGGSSSRVVRDVFGLPAAARPRVVRAREDPVLARRLRPLVRGFSGTGGFYVQSLTTGAGAAWNARARFPAASTLKLAIGVTALVRHAGVPVRGSYVDRLFREMIVVSDDEAANLMEVWMAGSTSAGSAQVNAMMRSIGLVDSIMYGGYLVRETSGRIPVRVDEQPYFGVGKYTTAWDMSGLWRAIWLASGGIGPLRKAQPGFTPADARYLLWLLAHVRDSRKLDANLRDRAGVSVLHKAGWINDARHDTGLVFWRGGVFVAGVMTWRSSGAGPSSDRLAGRVASLAYKRFRSPGG